MHNTTLERELAAHDKYRTGPLSWWRILAADDFASNVGIVEAAVASIAAVSQLVPPDLVNELTTAMEEERAQVWNDLTAHFLVLDKMQNGLNAEIAGSAAALSAHACSPLGLVMLLNMLSQPYTKMDPAERLAIAATWLGERGVILNRTTMAEVDWYQSGRGYQGEAYASMDDYE